MKQSVQFVLSNKQENYNNSKKLYNAPSDVRVRRNNVSVTGKVGTRYSVQRVTVSSSFLLVLMSNASLHFHLE